MEKKEIKKEILLSLPERKWNEIKSYKQLYIVPTRKKYSSGYTLMAIVGINDDDSMEISAYCDDILWHIPQIDGYDFRTDCEYPSGILHFWSRKYRYEVGHSLSSTDIRLINPPPKGDKGE